MLLLLPHDDDFKGLTTSTFGLFDSGLQLIHANVMLALQRAVIGECWVYGCPQCCSI